MADVDTNQLHMDHADIRREAAQYAADTRYNIADQSGTIRREISSDTGDLSKQMGAGFSDTRFNIADQASNIRRESAAGFGEVRYDIARGNDVLNDAIRVEGANTRTQSAAETGTIVTEGLKGDFNNAMNIKDSRFEIVSRIGEHTAQLDKAITDSTGDVANRVESNADRMTLALSTMDTKIGDRFFTVGRDLSDLRQGQATLSKDIELNSLKGQLDARANTTYLSDKITNDGEKTRALLNDLKYHDLNRALVERQTSLVNCEQDNRHWHSRYDDARWGQLQSQWGGQFAAMQNQLQSMNQNFNSQLSETRQGMVNFGTMAGVGQTSSANNVR